MKEPRPLRAQGKIDAQTSARTDESASAGSRPSVIGCMKGRMLVHDVAALEEPVDVAWDATS